MSAGTPKRAYHCQHADCDGILAVSAVQRGVLEGVCCPVCHRAQTVYLGGVDVPGGTKGGGATARRGADPRNPPIEAGPVRDWRRGR